MDDKWTINTNDPTLSNREDPIYKVAQEDIHEQYNINDPLKINNKVTGDFPAQQYNDGYNDPEKIKDETQYYDYFKGW